MPQPRVTVVGPHLAAAGGVSAVSAAWAAAGLFDEPERVRYWPSTRDGSRVGKLLYGGFRLARFALGAVGAGELVHLHVGVGWSLRRKIAYARLALRREARIVLHVHPTAFWDHLRELPPSALARTTEVLRAARAIVVLTREMHERFVSLGLGLSVHVLPNPVDVKAWDLEPAPGRDVATVAFVGWFTPEKGAELLLDAAVRLRETHPSLRLVFAGTHGEQELRDGIRRRGLGDRVEVAGWLDRRAIRELLHRATLLALPSRSEGMPMALIEAMACGTTIVASAVGGVPEILQDGRDARLVRPGDVGALAEAIGGLLSDPRTRETLAGHARERVARHDVGVVLPRLRAIWEQAAS
jgi:glycosyltransferase involved in cell wall biosynthesis